MEFILVGIFLLLAFFYVKSLLKKTREKSRQEYARQLDMLQERLNVLEETRIDPAKVMPRDMHENLLQGLEQKFNILLDDYEELQEKYDKTLSQKKSSEVRTGLIVETVAPFLTNFKGDPKNLVPVFRPIDYIEFDDEKIIFHEVKSGNSQLSTKQRKIKKMVEAGQVEFNVIRLNEEGLQ